MHSLKIKFTTTYRMITLMWTNEKSMEVTTLEIEKNDFQVFGLSGVSIKFGIV